MDHLPSPKEIKKIIRHLQIRPCMQPEFILLAGDGKSMERYWYYRWAWYLPVWLNWDSIIQEYCHYICLSLAL